MYKIKLYGAIGEWWDGNDSRTITDEIDALAEGEEIEVRIDSPGGSAMQGVSIYNALKNHPGKVRVIVDAYALSSASIIAMAGDEIVMREGAMMMIHNPWNITLGDADEHRKNADVLDKHRDSLASIYVAATGKTRDEINDIMAATTWLSAEDSVEQGFATSVASLPDAYDAAASLVAFADQIKDFSKVPDRLRAEVAAAMREHPQSKPHRAKAQGEKPMDKEEQKKIEDAQAQARAADLEAAAAKAVEAERTRAAAIRKACASVRAPTELADTLISEGVSAEAAGLRIVDALAQAQSTVPPNATASITGGKDEREKFVEGATKALSASAGFETHERGNPFNAMSLKEIAAESARRGGLDVKGMDPMAMVGAVLASAGHATSDFPLILEGLANKSLSRGYEEAAETFQLWTSKGSVSDFKPITRAKLNTYPALKEVPEGSEFKYATIGETGEVVQIATYGGLFALTRQAIINDDLGAFTRIPEKMGRAAHRTVGNLVYDILTANALMSDGNALFSAAHGNDASDTLTADALEAARAAMRVQMDSAGNLINITPGYLLVPAALEGTARRLLTAENFPGETVPMPNTVRGMGELIVDARLDADDPKRWYVIAGNAFDFIQVNYLNGVQAPVLERREGWTVDGTEYKVRLDVGAKALDYRTAYRSTGA